jgi:hypothetical protein
MKVVMLSALRTDCLYPLEIFLVLISLRGLVDPRGKSVAGRIISMKISDDTIGNQTRHLPSCSSVSQLTVPRRALSIYHMFGQMTAVSQISQLYS